MLTDARDLPRSTVLEADLCIVGAGAAGITLAREFIGTGRKVVLLESGGVEFDQATQDLYRGDVIGAPLLTGEKEVRLDEARLRLFGGTTNHWAGFCRPYEPIDFESRDWLPISGWPFALDELEPYYRRAHDLILLGPYEYGWQYWNDQHQLGTPLLDNERIGTVLFHLNYPMLYGAVYRAELVDSADVEVVLWANAVNLATRDGATIDSVQCRTLSGNDLEVRASVVVVALGGMETPRLLLASQDAGGQGVGNENDLVGRHFTEHLQVYAGFAVLSRPREELGLYKGAEFANPSPLDPDRKFGIRGALALTSDVIRSEQMLGMEAQLVFADLPDGGPYQDTGVTANDTAALAGATTGPTPTVAYVQVLGEQQLNPESRVVLADDADALGMPRMQVDWQHSPLDRASILKGMTILGEELGAAGLGRLQLAPGSITVDPSLPSEGKSLLNLYRVEPGRGEPDSFPLGVGFHHMCSCRMDRDPTRGVVDERQRVHGTENLYIASSAVFPTGGVSTPTYTITAMTLRLAEHLKGQL